MNALVAITRTPAHAHMLMNTYFANWPAQETQQQYKDMGALCSQYWFHELKRIFAATLHYTDQFNDLPYLEYYTKKYPGNSVRIADMTPDDKADILHAFTTQLGMHWSIFPFTVADIDKEVKRT